MKEWAKSLQVALTFIGTVVGAGFASGREVMQFFTRFGFWAPLLIILSTLFFVWIGTKVMLLSASLNAKSYEDLNKYLFGEKAGRWVSHLMLLILLGVNAVMLAGAGSIFSEHLNLSYQSGLLITMFACFMLLRRGMNAILTINTFVVPMMIGFTVFLVVETLRNPSSVHWLTAPNESSPWAAWLSPFLYAAFNLSMSQAVLVPLGASIGKKKYYGGAHGWAESESGFCCLPDMWRWLHGCRVSCNSKSPWPASLESWARGFIGYISFSYSWKFSRLWLRTYSG